MPRFTILEHQIGASFHRSKPSTRLCSLQVAQFSELGLPGAAFGGGHRSESCATGNVKRKNATNLVVGADAQIARPSTEGGKCNASVASGSTHWDWLFESESADAARDARSLLTWATDPVDDAELTARNVWSIDAISLPPHRAIYLDYEGDIGGDRGTVRAIARGTYEGRCRKTGLFHVVITVRESLRMPIDRECDLKIVSQPSGTAVLTWQQF